MITLTVALILCSMDITLGNWDKYMFFFFLKFQLYYFTVKFYFTKFGALIFSVESQLISKYFGAHH